MVQNAIKYNRIRRESCEMCGARSVQAHHDDYDKPLAVRWLCPQHHKEVHLTKPDRRME
jgi:ribosomal protein S27AE